jgi:hypothetical protein
MSAVTITDNTDPSVNISWTAPSSNGSPITQYQIQILSSDGVTYYTDTTDCDGSSATVVSNLYCNIPMATLTSSPYSLTLGTLIVAIVSAENEIGWSVPSLPNTNGSYVSGVPG